MPETFADGWARLAPVLQRALDESGTGGTVAMARAAVQAREAFVWFGQQSIIVARLQENMRYGRQCELMAAGRPEEVARKLLPQVEAWAQRQGCAQVLFYGRVGWTRLLPRFGRPQYQVTRHLYARELEPHV